MGKKTKKGAPRPKLHRQAEPNKFERSTNKKRFEVLGRKVKGDVRHIGRLRTAAAEKVSTHARLSFCSSWELCMPTLQLGDVPDPYIRSYT